MHKVHWLFGLCSCHLLCVSGVVLWLYLVTAFMGLRNMQVSHNCLCQYFSSNSPESETKELVRQREELEGLYPVCREASLTLVSLLNMLEYKCSCQTVIYCSTVFTFTAQQLGKILFIILR